MKNEYKHSTPVGIAGWKGARMAGWGMGMAVAVATAALFQHQDDKWRRANMTINVGGGELGLPPACSHETHTPARQHRHGDLSERVGWLANAINRSLPRLAGNLSPARHSIIEIKQQRLFFLSAAAC